MSKNYHKLLLDGIHRNSHSLGRGKKRKEKKEKKEKRRRREKKRTALFYIECNINILY